MIRRVLPLFIKDLELFSLTINVSFAKVLKRLVLLAHSSAQRHSPVDTGRFRASWGTSVGFVPAEKGHPPVPKGSRVPAKAAKSRMASLSELDRNPYKDLFIYNNLSYAELLERGHSQQAPYGVTKLVEAEILQDVATELSKHV